MAPRLSVGPLFNGILRKTMLFYLTPADFVSFPSPASWRGVDSVTKPG